MSQAQNTNTPGPWYWEADEVKGDPYGRTRYQVTAMGKTITKVYYSSYEGGFTNAEADALLISAAPDLLGALQMAKSLLEIEGYEAGGTSMRVIDAAITKATQR